MNIDCICIDDTNKPNDIPNSSWIKKGNQYTIIKIYKTASGIAVQLEEIALKPYFPYTGFLIGRFAIPTEQLEELEVSQEVEQTV